MADLVDLLLGLLSREDPRRLGDRLLDLVAARYNTRRAALWSRDRDRCALFLARGVGQDALDGVRKLWASRKEALKGGSILVARSGLGPKELRQAAQAGGAQSAALAPALQRGELVGLLYLDTPEARFQRADDLEGLRQLARIAAVAVTAPPAETPGEAIAAYLERMPEDAVARDQLLVLLQRHELNISQVARGLGITRATVYQRLARFGISRDSWKAQGA
jgi:transcriptional regulator with GAF, ATPase, and Fis domain